MEQDVALKHFLEMVVLDKSKVILMATTNKAVVRQCTSLKNGLLIFHLLSASSGWYSLWPIIDK